MTMAAVSNAPTTTIAATSTALTPPSSSHGDEFPWNSPPQRLEDTPYDQRRRQKAEASQNGGAPTYSSSDGAADQATYRKFGSAGEPPALVQKPNGYMSPQPAQENGKPGRSKDASTTVLADSPMDLPDDGRNGGASESNKRTAAAGLYGSDPDDVSSKWIHRDKLARIESEELQAAGIILPKSRARSKPRRDVSLDQASGYRTGGADDDMLSEPRPRQSSASFRDRKIQNSAVPSWDLRFPEEIAEQAYFASPAGSKGVSRIPVAKLSPVPIPQEHMERDTPMARKRDGSPGAEESIAYPKPRSRSAGTRTGDGGTVPVPASPQRNPTRSASDLSPKKLAAGNGTGGSTSSTTGTRKASAPAKTNSGAGRPKTRNGASKDSNSSGTATTRPSTRSGERELSREFAPGAASKQPEGDPPWMISAYRPDPRLPPDQQLLPTVAKRLQQEKWEREGKFGNIYDKEFRPLTDDGFLSPPEPSEKPLAGASNAVSGSEKQDEWPLKPESKSPTSPQGRTGSYTTIPRIQEKPNISPLPSPRGAATHMLDTNVAQAPPLLPADDEATQKSCGCCIVM